MFIKLFFRGTDETFTKPLNEGRKNWMMAIVLAIMSLGYIQQANAQNVVVDEILRTKYDSITLDPNKSIKENCKEIDDFLYLHSENIYTDFIAVRGHYVGYRNNSYDFPIGTIRDDLSVREQVIDVLTNLYSHSLDINFPQVSTEEYDFIKVDNSYFYSLLSSSLLYKKIHDKVVKEYWLSFYGKH